MALKEVVQDPRYKNRQLSVISLLSHPNLIEMKDYYFTMKGDDCILHIIMEFMDTSLHSMIRKQRDLKAPISAHLRKIYAFQIMKGLYYTDLNHVCHRDLKPANVLVDLQHHTLKICDFGSAKIIHSRENNVSYICSRYYRAPELLLNCTTYGPEIDMWSAGCILLELMTLEPIFPGDSSLEQLIEIVKLLGTPSQDNLSSYSDISQNISLPKVKPANWQMVFKRYSPSQHQLDFIRSILTYNMQKRLTPLEALKHPYFHNIQNLSESQIVEGLFDFQSLKNKANTRAIRQLQKMYPAEQQKDLLRENQAFQQQMPTHDSN